MANVNAQVLGYNSTNYAFSNASKQSLVEALGSGRAVTLGTLGNASAGGLVGGHAYTVVNYNPSTDTFVLHNPWGFSHPSPMTWAQLQSNCSVFTVTDPTGSTAISTQSVRLRSEIEAPIVGLWVVFNSIQENAPRVKEVYVEVLSFADEATDLASSFDVDEGWETLGNAVSDSVILSKDEVEIRTEEDMLVDLAMTEAHLEDLLIV
jgi:hypothetical protein